MGGRGGGGGVQNFEVPKEQCSLVKSTSLLSVISSPITQHLYLLMGRGVAAATHAHTFIIQQFVLYPLLSDEARCICVLCDHMYTLRYTTVYQSARARSSPASLAGETTSPHPTLATCSDA